MVSPTLFQSVPPFFLVSFPLFSPFICLALLLCLISRDGFLLVVEAHKELPQQPLSLSLAKLSLQALYSFTEWLTDWLTNFVCVCVCRRSALSSLSNWPFNLSSFFDWFCCFCLLYSFLLFSHLAPLFFSFCIICLP